MRATIARLVAFLGLSLALVGGATSIAGTAPALTIQVTDESGRRIQSASAVVLGSDPGAAYALRTNAEGLVTLDRLSPGLYTVRVFFDGFSPYRSTLEIGVDPLQMKVILRRVPRIIASVIASSATISRESISSNSALRKVSPTLLDAMNQLAGVRVAGGGNGVGIQASLQGRDSSQTSFTLDGSPVGSGAALAVNTDLLSAAQVQQDSETVNLSFLSPSIDPRYGSDLNAGNFGSSFVKSTVQGMVGQVGFAGAHTIRGAESALNGRTYLDESGETYRHVGALVTRGDMLKVTGSVHDWNVSAFDTWSHSSGTPLPAYFGGTLPAGFGPGLRRETFSSNPLFTANGTLGNLGTSVSLSQWHLRDIDDERSRVIGNTPLPFFGEQNLNGTDATVSVNVEHNDHLSYTFSGSFVTNLSSASQVLAGVAPASATYSFDRETTFAAAQHLRAGHGLLLDGTIEARRVDASPFGLTLKGSATWNTSTAGDWGITANVGDRPIVSNDPRNLVRFPDPGQAQFDCGAKTITLDGPGDMQSRASSRRLSVGYSRSGRAGRASVSVYDERTHGVLMSGALVPLVNEPLSLLSPAYVDALRRAYATIGGCTGISPQDDSIFVSQDLGGLDVAYRGANLSASVSLGKRLALYVTYDYSAAQLASYDERLASARSPFVVGSQLPNIPLQRASFVFDWSDARQRTEALLNLSYSSSNNQRNLPAYTVANIGLVRHISPTINVFGIVTNATSIFPGLFVSPDGAKPLRTVSGEPLPTLGAPIGPMRFYLGIQLRINRSDPMENINQ